MDRDHKIRLAVAGLPPKERIKRIEHYLRYPQDLKRFLHIRIEHYSK